MQTEQLNTYPQPAIFADENGISALNDKATALFPNLKPGLPLPGALIPPEGEQIWEGAAVVDGRGFQIRCEQQEGGYVYTFQPRTQMALSEGQLDGALYQLRTLMGEFYRDMAPCISGEQERLTEQEKERFARTFDRQLRLMDHLDFLRDVKDNAVWLNMEEVDLDLLCSRTALECDGLLRETGVRVAYVGAPVPVYVRGDEQRLRDALTELISNCARRKVGTITIQLKRRGRQAMICVTDDGGSATPGQRLTMTTRGAMPLIPTPDMGAGLGLSVAEKTMWLHGGAMLFSAGEGAPRVYLSMSVSSGGGMSLRAPAMERNAGRNPYVIALSDVLPGKLIREDWKA